MIKLFDLKISNSKSNWVKFSTKFFALALFLSFITPTAEAQIVPASKVKVDVARMFEQSYSRTVKGEVQVKITATPFADLQLPDGRITYKIAGGDDKILPRDVKRVNVYVNGVLQRTLNLPAQTSIYRDVLVASDTINREQTLTKDCTTVKKVDVANRADFVLGEEMLDKEITTRKIFQKGEIIDKRFVKMRPDVAKFSDVRVFFVSNGSVMVTIDGKAMMDGMMGDYINVENRNYKKVYNGKIIGQNKVLVNI